MRAGHGYAFWGAVIALCGCFAASMGACSSGNEQAASCDIPPGMYTFVQTGSGGEQCMSGTVTQSWPPSAMQGGAAVSDTCVQNAPGGGCELICYPPAGSTGESLVVAYTLSGTGFSGTQQTPVNQSDGGVVCTYTFTATKM